MLDHGTQVIITNHLTGREAVLTVEGRNFAGSTLTSYSLSAPGMFGVLTYDREVVEAAVRG